MELTQLTKWMTQGQILVPDKTLDGEQLLIRGFQILPNYITISCASGHIQTIPFDTHIDNVECTECLSPYNIKIIVENNVAKVSNTNPNIDLELLIRRHRQLEIFNKIVASHQATIEEIGTDFYMTCRIRCSADQSHTFTKTLMEINSGKWCDICTSLIGEPVIKTLTLIYQDGEVICTGPSLNSASLNRQRDEKINMFNKIIKEQGIKILNMPNTLKGKFTLKYLDGQVRFETMKGLICSSI